MEHVTAPQAESNSTENVPIWLTPIQSDEREPFQRHFRMDSPERKSVQAEFLRALRETGQYYLSALRVGVTYRTIQNWQRDDPEFDAACLERWNVNTDGLALEVHRRAFDEKGMPGVVAALATLKQRRPQEWSEKHIVIADSGTTALTAALGRVAELIERANPRARVTVEGSATEVLPSPEGSDREPAPGRPGPPRGPSQAPGVL